MLSLKIFNRILTLVVILVSSVFGETLFEVKDSANNKVLDVSTDGLRVMNQGDTLMVISSDAIRANISSSKGLSRSFSVTTNSSKGKGLINALRVGSSSTTMSAPDGEYTNFSPLNIFMGLESGSSIGPGKYNVMIGNYAGNGTVGVTDFSYYGWSNTFLGESAGRYATNSSHNVYIGKSSGSNNSDGGDNTFIGTFSGQSNLGSCNTYIGSSSGGNGSGSGSFNTYLGYLSGGYTSTGSYNVMLGDRAGYNLRAGSSNVSLGYRAGYSNQSGTGNYDGNEKVISGLYVNRPATDHIGLFGSTGTGSSIKNTGVRNVNLTGEDYVGGIVGYQYGGTIERCFSSGQIKGLTMLGGFAGYVYMLGIIENCYTSATVTAVTGSTEYIGGFSGRNFNGTVKKCYSTGSVHYAATTDPTTRGFIGTLGSTTIMSDNFWDIESSGQVSSSGGATGKTTAEMRSIATYTSLFSSGLTNPWDFVGNYYDDMGYNDYWNMHQSLNSGYPYLNWEYRIPVEAPANIALTVGVSNVTITWDAVTGAAAYLVYSSADPYGTFTLDGTGTFNGTEWTGPFAGSKMFYYVVAVNDTKVITAKTINLSGNAGR
jgi:hypothetical protein